MEFPESLPAIEDLRVSCFWYLTLIYLCAVLNIIPSCLKRLESKKKFALRMVQTGPSGAFSVEVTDYECR